jgi:hypothetical protein
MVEGIIIVDLPTWFDHEEEKSNARPGYQCEHDKKHFHDGPPREIYATIDCTDNGENGFQRRASTLGRMGRAPGPLVAEHQRKGRPFSGPQYW